MRLSVFGHHACAIDRAGAETACISVLYARTAATLRLGSWNAEPRWKKPRSFFESQISREKFLAVAVLFAESLRTTHCETMTLCGHRKTVSFTSVLAASQTGEHTPSLSARSPARADELMEWSTARLQRILQPFLFLTKCDITVIQPFIMNLCFFTVGQDEHLVALDARLNLLSFPGIIMTVSV